MDHSTKETALVIIYWDDIPDNFTGVISYNGYYFWYINGQRHRDDGPAAIFSNGEKYWYLNGKSYSQEEWFELLTPEQQEKAVWNMDQW